LSIKKTLTAPRPVELVSPVELESVILPEGQTKMDMGMMVKDDVLTLASTGGRRKVRQAQVGEVQVPQTQVLWGLMKVRSKWADLAVYRPRK
jgi:hypothetical protein